MSVLSQFTSERTITIRMLVVASGGGGAGAVGGGAYGGGGGGGGIYYDELELPRGTSISINIGAGGAGGPGATGGSGGFTTNVDIIKWSGAFGVGDILYSKQFLVYSGGGGGGGGGTYGAGGPGGCGGGMGQGSSPNTTSGTYNIFTNELGFNGKSSYCLGRRTLTSAPADTTNNVITNLSPGFYGVDGNWLGGGSSNISDTMGGGLNLYMFELWNVVPSSNYFDRAQNPNPLVSVGGYYNRAAGISTANTGNGGNGVVQGATGENGQSGIALVTYDSALGSPAERTGSCFESDPGFGYKALVFTGDGRFTLPR